jgi:hypothetical protein
MQAPHPGLNHRIQSIVFDKAVIGELPLPSLSKGVATSMTVVNLGNAV